MQTYDAKKKKKNWALKDVIFLAVIGIFFGIIYQVWSYAYYAMAATPLKPFANDATLGVWIMAGPLAGVLIQKSARRSSAKCLLPQLRCCCSQAGALRL